MPKEVVRRAFEQDAYDVYVGWQPDCDVQLGVEMEGHMLGMLLGGVHEDTDSRNRQMAELGCIIREALDKARTRMTEGDDPGRLLEDATIGRAVIDAICERFDYRGVWAHLNRGGCNRLIKMLRRARDSAFGRDE